MNRRGFLLLSALWLVAALSALALTALAAADLGARASRNRIGLIRARWAREACGEIMLARGGASVDSTDLGQRIWCEAELEDPARRINVNLAPAPLLRALLGDTLSASLADWIDPDQSERPAGAERDWYLRHHRRGPPNQPLRSIDELELIRGFSSSNAGRLHRLLTVRGEATININEADPELLRELPGIGAEAAALIETRRATQRPIQSIDHLASQLSPSGRAILMANYSGFSQIARFAPERLVARVTGRVGGTDISASVTITLAPAGNRLAVLRRESE